MGSAGSGNFSDYSGNRPNQNGQGSRGSGGSSEEDRCARAFSSNLEEIETCEYYKKNNTVPNEGTPISVDFSGRIRVLDLGSQLCIGYLPTSFNYLRACITDGFSYLGAVSSSSMNPIATVKVDIMPQK